MKNIEIKARCSDLERARGVAREVGAVPAGILRQIDTFFPSAHGRLKLRAETVLRPETELRPKNELRPKTELRVETEPRAQTGGVERAELIFYERPDETGPKASAYDLVPVADPERLRQVLGEALGVGAEVRKTRELWMLERTRIHLDEVDGLGSFIEFEVEVNAGDDEDARTAIAHALVGSFEIRPEDLVRGAYADLIHAKAIHARTIGAEGTEAAGSGPV